MKYKIWLIQWTQLKSLIQIKVAIIVPMLDKDLKLIGLGDEEEGL